MTVIKSTNDDLRKYVYNKQYVVVKFHNESDCSVCKDMEPVFERLSKKHKDITFATMDTYDNPVAKQLITKEKKPFIGIYKDGLLVECALVSSEEALAEMLDKLPNINFDL